MKSNDMSKLDLDLLKAVNNLTQMPGGALSIRKDGQVFLRNSSPNILISSALKESGLIIEVKPGTKDETVHIPVILTKSGLKDQVYNTFIIGENSEVTIIAGCGIHNDSHGDSMHNGIHEIIVKNGAKIKYVEKHYGQGNGRGKRIMHPTTIVRVETGAMAEMEMVQIEGIDDTIRETRAVVLEKASLKIAERLLTDGNQKAVSNIDIVIEGKDGNAQILSRSIAKGNSEQVFKASLKGQTACWGHIECDSIIMQNARIQSIPELTAEDSDAVLTHEAAIGKIAGEQLIKLMSLGLTEKEAIDTILNGFLR